MQDSLIVIRFDIFSEIWNTWHPILYKKYYHSKHFMFLDSVQPPSIFYINSYTFPYVTNSKYALTMISVVRPWLFICRCLHYKTTAAADCDCVTDCGDYRLCCVCVTPTSMFSFFYQRKPRKFGLFCVTPVF